MADINFTDQDFSDQVLKSEMPVVVDFGLHGVRPVGS